MQSNIALFKRSTSVFLRYCAIIIAGLLISACDGGIQGTGDGMPPIVIDPDGNSGGTDDGGVATADTGADVSVNDPTNSAPGETPEASPDSTQQIPQLNLSILDALLQLVARIENTSTMQPVVAQLISLQQDLAATLNLTSTSEEIATQNISGAFETTTRYEQDGTDTVIAQSSASALSYIFSNNSERAFHVFQYSGGSSVRYLDRNSNTLLQANIILLPGDVMVIEADQNNNGTQTYLQTHSTSGNTTVFSQHPTDASIARQREIIDATGTITTLQNCTAASQNCTSANSWSNPGTNTDATFESALGAINSSIAAIDVSFINTQLASIPDNINEIVLTQSTEPQPTQEQILCGVQRVSGNLRHFCLLPQPFDVTGTFSETLDGGEIFYQPIE